MGTCKCISAGYGSVSKGANDVGQDAKGYLQLAVWQSFECSQFCLHLLGGLPAIGALPQQSKPFLPRGRLDLPRQIDARYMLRVLKGKQHDPVHQKPATGIDTAVHTWP